MIYSWIKIQLLIDISSENREKMMMVFFHAISKQRKKTMKNILINSWRHWYKSVWTWVCVFCFSLIKWLFTREIKCIISISIKCLCLKSVWLREYEGKNSASEYTKEFQVNTQWTMMIERMQMTMIFDDEMFQLKSKHWIYFFLIVLVAVTYAYYNVIIQFIGCYLPCSAWGCLEKSLLIVFHSYSIIFVFWLGIFEIADRKKTIGELKYTNLFEESNIFMNYYNNVKLNGFIVSV